MKFNSSKKMREYIQSGRDIYSPSLEIYMFLYNEEGAICQYSIRQDEAKELNEKDEYWGAYLGTGGIIYDDPVDDLFKGKYYIKIRAYTYDSSGKKVYSSWKRYKY